MRVAVIGAGMVGLSTTASLLQHGADVVCYDKGEPMGERSTGESRIFRFAHTDAGLVELAVQSRAVFDSWSEDANERLIEDTETVISGADVDAWSSAMASVGARHTVVDNQSPLLRLPTSTIPTASLIDHAGGVLKATRIGAYLRARFRCGSDGVSDAG